MGKGKDNREDKRRQAYLRRAGKEGMRTYSSKDMNTDVRAPHLPVFRRMAGQAERLVIVMPMRAPDFKAILLDRFLVAASRDNLEPCWFCSKTDLQEEGDIESFQAWKKVYEALGLVVLSGSTVTGEGLPEVRAFLAEKPAMLAGQSGAGKSSLINALAGRDVQATAALSASSGKGRHTTVRPVLVDLGDGLKIWDLPGIKTLKLWDVPKVELREHFSELRGLSCRYGDCLHTGEDGCGLPELLASGALHPSRHQSYLGMLEEAWVK